MNKSKQGDGVVLMRTFVLKKINKGKHRTHHEIGVPEKVVPVITKECP